MSETAMQETAQDEQEEFAWVNVSPGTRLRGEVRELIYAGQLDSSVEDNRDSFGVVLDNVEVVDGEVFVNTDKPDGELTITEDETHKTDYRVVDTDDDSVTMLGDSGMISDRAGATYEPGELTDETIMVWYNGLSGQRVGRTLDYNGIPYAEYKEDGYLMKGLYQFPEGWRTANSEGRRELVQSGKKPRVVRRPLLRSDVGTIEVELERSGRAYYANLFDAEGEDLDMVYNENAEERFNAEDLEMYMFHGDGWQDRPSNAKTPMPTFNIQIEEDSEDEFGLGLTEQAFVTSVVGALDDTGHTPETAFTGGLRGLADQQGLEADESTLESIELSIYTKLDHLDVTDLEE